MRAALWALLVGAFFSSPAFAAYPDHAESTRTDVTVHVVWVKSYAEADAICAAIAGETARGTILACYAVATQTIYAVQPTSFNDQFGLMVLGHEFWHALGADHP